MVLWNIYPKLQPLWLHVSEAAATVGSTAEEKEKKKREREALKAEKRKKELATPARFAAQSVWKLKDTRDKAEAREAEERNLHALYQPQERK